MRHGLVAALFLVGLVDNSSQAINIKLDYTYDNSNFFGAGNPDGPAAGAQAKATLEAVVAYFSEIIDDSLPAISTPDPFYSSYFDGVYTWEWSAKFANPATGATQVLPDFDVAADEYLIFAGARPISGTTLGIGGAGSYSWSADYTGSGFTSEEIDQIETITDDFIQLIERRNEPIGNFASWGGSITFDNDPSTNWHWNHTTDVLSGENDFYSVAIHEMAHALGFSSSNEWINLVSGGVFLGSNAYAANGNVYPSTNGGHWQYNTQSTVYGTTTSQEAAMDPDITEGTRKHFTTLDAAGLADIGWEVSPPEIPGLAGDFDDDDDVDGQDFLLWQRGGSPVPYSADDHTDWQMNYGMTLPLTTATAVPEPTAFVLVASLLVTLTTRR